MNFPAEGSDLEPIVHYVANDNPRRSLSFVQELRGKCEALAYNPLAFPLVLRYEGYGRRRVHGNYLIFYRVDAKQVVIVHVLHGASDYAAVLFER